ncbi:ATP-dependent DNA ligase [Solirubrobacter sp. CPCC 204708]|uniref:ATP-dependent DNA ligase n=1 Tax=Solirubrobacter deserti TaxID=2282478 RepID=A0ABT4RQW2_9ACTN|nr:ATP-dependent DNA ligase [Solirubrobacter deserti]MBE2320099.1 ATP-dependent DNA ligase [Solirubrobacter deserti]MDA0140962.1 ATP-dependent DNA ligase [Solirubrobacter deserti]
MDVAFTSLDKPLFDGAEATKGDLVAYLEAVADPLIEQLRDRPLSVMRARPGQKPFMQKNVPKNAPDWIKTVGIWAERSKREVRYALCNDKPTLLWFANQRAIEYHPTLWPQTHLVLDLDPPPGAAFDVVAATALLVREALAAAGLQGALKTSGSKGVHIFVPVSADGEEIAHATRALAARAVALDPSIATTAYVVEEREGKVFVDSTRAGGATVVAAYSPRIRPGVPVSFPVPWDDVTRITPADFTIRTVPALLEGRDPWVESMPAPQALPTDLVEEGRAIPVARVVAMHEGKRRKRAADERA